MGEKGQGRAAVLLLWWVERWSFPYSCSAWERLKSHSTDGIYPLGAVVDTPPAGFAAPVTGCVCACGPWIPQQGAGNLTEGAGGSSVGQSSLTFLLHQSVEREWGRHLGVVSTFLVYF